jgi:hypothetical protein
LSFSQNKTIVPSSGTIVFEKKEIITQINMKNIENLKKLTFISFLIIVFPGDHVTLINIIAILITFFQFFSSICIDTIGMESVLSLFFSGIAILSLVLIFNKSKLLSMISILVQYIWLIYCFNQNNLSSIYYLISLSLFIILSLVLIYVQLKKYKPIN